MKVQGINQIDTLIGSKQNKPITNENVFKEVYDQAMNVINETNNLQKQAQQVGQDFILGKVDNIHDVTIAQEKAYTALQFTVQVRDKVLEAYNEIMRMQI